ncbi:MAG: hypothetical protein OXH76_02065 [Boseongicola sp.]|nr:hypothetical protein [Boseongicola sp.]
MWGSQIAVLLDEDCYVYDHDALSRNVEENGLILANKWYDLRLIQDYLGHRDPRHTAHYTRCCTDARTMRLTGPPVAITWSAVRKREGGSNIAVDQK